MEEIIQEQVNVATTITQHKLTPSAMLWRQRTYEFLSCSMRYNRLEGDTLLHIFYMTTENACMQIQLNTKNLTWTLIAMEPI